MTTQDTPRFPHLGKLSLAILEHLVQPVIGDKAIEEIRAPLLAKGQQEQLAQTLADAEKRFTDEHGDPELCRAVLDLPLAGLPSLQRALGTFYSRPTDATLAKVLRERLATDFPLLPAERIDAAVSVYLTVLRQELVHVSPEIRDKLSALATLAMQSDIARMATRVDEMADDVVRMAETLSKSAQVAPQPGSAPPLPALIIGREDDLRDLKTRLGISTGGQASASLQVLTAVRGWPGVGKTTLAAAVAHDPDVAQAFPDGVLWVSLGPNPSLLSELAAWGRALGTDDLLRARTVEEASAQLAALLRNKRMLLIVDDVWEAGQAVPFKVGGRGCAMLVTTRINKVAQDLAPTPNDIYRLAVLTDDNAMALLRTLAPAVVARHPHESLELVRELEGLPLALQVAGHLLNVEAGYGFGVTNLIAELREGARLLEAQAPADRADLANETTPTIAVLLQRSTDRLESHVRDCFALLGPFAPKPATFDLAAMAAVWQVEDPKPIVRQLADRGLLEPVGERFQMHALLVRHAASLLTD